MTAALTLDQITVRRRSRVTVDSVSLTLKQGEMVGLIGPNGAGKTTLMRAALGLLPAKGTSSLAQMRPEARARAAAWLPQAREIAWPVSVATLVGLGRMPHGTPGPQDHAAVARALAQTDLTPFADRPATELSGGEQARVLLARALAQDTPLILADEPIAGLDPAHQIAAMEQFAALAQDGRTALVALHDLALAARYCTRLIVLDQGRLVADGTPDQVLTADILARVFGIEADLTPGPTGPTLTIKGRLHA